MSDREWWPAFMADEVMPIPESSPSAWIREALGEKWLIAERVEDRIDDESIREEIAPGETMDFVYCDQLPPALIRVNADGSYELVGGTVSGANNFVVTDNWDFMADTPGALAADLAEQGELWPVPLICRYWSDEIPHRFEIGEDGPRFIALADVPPPHRDPDLFDKEGGE